MEKKVIGSSDRIGRYTQDSRVRIISASVKADGLNKYGVVTRGRIVIEGAICAATFGKSSGPLPPSLFNIVRSEDDFHFNYDTPTSKASVGGTAYCLLIGSFRDPPNTYKGLCSPGIDYCGLILMSTSGGKFERIGLWEKPNYENDEDTSHLRTPWAKTIAGVSRVEII
ncbi:hypothetical protein M422DRAFT_247542 [Sphaerobolus stellatus SS14]|nr:hypothetical protein M422DRAFT_247542 [Sphaerobolus stellatus SS14]